MFLTPLSERKSAISHECREIFCTNFPWDYQLLSSFIFDNWRTARTAGGIVFPRRFLVSKKVTVEKGVVSHGLNQPRAGRPLRGNAPSAWSPYRILRSYVRSNLAGNNFYSLNLGVAQNRQLLNSAKGGIISSSASPPGLQLSSRICFSLYSS